MEVGTMSGTLDVRPYGRTGEQATAIGLGGGNLSKHSHDVGVATVRRALELGITYFDTSPAYGRGASQLVLGEALEGWQGKYMLATKLGYLATPGDFRSLESLRSQLRENLRALRRNRVDVLQLHVAELACWWRDGAAPDELVDTSAEFDFTNSPAMQVLAEAKEQGVCRFFGITGDEADELSFVLDHVDVDVCLLAYNYTLLSRRALERMMPLAREKGAAFVAAGILKTGFIQVHPEWLSTPPDWVTPEVRDRLKMLYDVQRESGLSILSLAIRYIISDPDVATVLVGAATPAEVEDSVAAAEEGPLPSDIKRAVDELGISTKGDPRAA
jgi:L-galactose dehydrogenase